MMFDIAQLLVFLATLVAFGYYVYLIGRVAGLLKAVDVLLKEEEEK